MQSRLQKGKESADRPSPSDLWPYENNMRLFLSLRWLIKKKEFCDSNNTKNDGIKRFSNCSATSVVSGTMGRAWNLPHTWQTLPTNTRYKHEGPTSFHILGHREGNETDQRRELFTREAFWIFQLSTCFPNGSNFRRDLLYVYWFLYTYNFSIIYVFSIFYHSHHLSKVLFAVCTHQKICTVPLRIVGCIWLVYFSFKLFAHLHCSMLRLRT